MSDGVYVRVKYRDEVCFEQKFRAISGDTIVLTVDDLVDEKVKAEREAVAQSLDKQADLACDDIDRQWAQEMAAAVRARGQG